MKRLILLLLLLPVIVSAQVVYIPDSAFKAYLVGNTAINLNGDDSIQVSEATAYADTIDVMYLNISDLTGIEAFTTLTNLYCSHNSLTSIDVSNSVALTSLRCDWNDLSNIDVSALTALTYLNCYNSNVTSLNVSGCTSLTSLYCDHNNLTNLDVSGCTALVTLDCDYNDLTSLDLSQNTALKECYCGANSSLTSLDVTNNSALTSFYCNYNNLTSLDLSKNTALRALHCYGNNLTSLDISNNTALRYLWCDNNELTSLDVSNHTALIELKCYYNSLTSLNVRNGNNVNMFGKYYGFHAENNPSLNCISVDDTTWANANWSSAKDAGTVFSNDCATLGIENNHSIQPSITSYDKTIAIKGNGTATIFNLQGQRVYHSKLFGNTFITLDKGIYLVRVTDEGKNYTKKVYIQ
ncbi:MAG: leucine-rich repeat domain-containing protein [Flavobacteriales bacterium]|nr:leucine-rich repeat domain-containing protein [Flavobacteriales bacterium]